MKIYLPITEQLYQSHSSAVKRLNTICCHDLTIHLWLHWKSPFIITGADWRGGGGHGGLFPRIQCARGGGEKSTNEIYCETKRSHNAQITNRSYGIWQTHNVAMCPSRPATFYLYQTQARMTEIWASEASNLKRLRKFTADNCVKPNCSLQLKWCPGGR